MNVAFLIGRILFGSFFAFSGINHFKDVQTMKGYAAMKKVPAPGLAVVGSGVLLLLGGISILLGAWPQIGIWLIVAFLLGVSFPMHNFWAIQEPQQRMNDQINFMKNMALLGAALMLLMLPLPWPLALNLGQ